MNNNAETTTVRSQAATYSETEINASIKYESVEVTCDGKGIMSANPVSKQLHIRTLRKIPKTGLLLVGFGGNNGSTALAGLIANRRNLSWRTREKTHTANWTGSLIMSSTLRLGQNISTGEDVYVPLNSLVPFLNPVDFCLGGWDVSAMALGDAMRRAKVLDINLQDQLFEEMQTYSPMSSIYVPHFVAGNQVSRSNNTKTGTLQEQLDSVREDIRNFKLKNGLDKVIVLWTATTERFSDVTSGVHDTIDNWMAAIEKGHTEVSASSLFATASILEGCSYINGSPQNTFVPAVVQLAKKYNVFLGGDDFKSGQTKIKSLLVDFLISAGIKPKSIASYNHLGNNDGLNLSSAPQFRSKEITKSTVVDDMIVSNPILYKPSETLDHCVVIKYLEHVGDSKRALDEYSSEIFLGGANTLVIHNTCEDSLLATPLLFDLAMLTELCQRITIRVDNSTEAESMHSVLSILSYLCKAPMVPEGAPVINALNPQRQCIVNFLRACVGLGPEAYVGFEYKIPSILEANKKRRC